MNVLTIQYRGGNKVSINTTWKGAREIVRTAQRNLFPIVEIATFNGMDVLA